MTNEIKQVQVTKNIEIAIRSCECTSRNLAIRSGDDLKYHKPNVWYIAYVVCKNCGRHSSPARCSDEDAAREYSVYLWNSGPRDLSL